MFISKDDRLRHRILKRLIELDDIAHEKHGSTITTEQSSITTKQLADELKVSVQDIQRVSVIMVKSDEINYDDFGKGECLYAWNNAALAYFDKKYPTHGKELFRKDVAFYLSLSVVISIVLSVISTCNSCKTSLHSKEETQNLQRQINELKGKRSSLTLQRKYPC